MNTNPAHPTTNNKKTKRAQGNVAIGHPVNVATGTLYHEFTDYELSGSIPLNLPRRYSTALLDQPPNIFGSGWHCSLVTTISRDIDGYVMTDPTGETEIAFNITQQQLAEGAVARNFGAFYELALKNQELCVTHWNVDSGHVQHDYFPIPKNDEPSYLIRREDAESNTLLFSYNNKNQLTEITQKREKRSLKLLYNHQGYLHQVFRHSDVLNQTQQEKNALLQYDYDQQGRLIKFTNPLGQSSHYRYDDHNLMINERTLAGMIYTFRFDQQGRCVYLSGENDFDLHRLEYHDLTRTTEVTNSQGHITRYHWNEYNQVEKVISPLGHMTSTLYDDDDRIIAEITPSGLTTKYDYDQYGNRCLITSADGSTVQYTFNTNHQAIAITDPLGNTWQRIYDDNGHLIRITNPHNISQSFTYNAQGDLIRHTNDKNHQRLFQWDNYGNLLQASDWKGAYSQYRWDAFGHLTHYIDAAGHITTMQRDRLGHLTELTLPDGNKRYYEWDIYDNLKRYTDENNITTQWNYCQCGNIEEELKPDGNKISYSWDAIPGQLAHLTNEKGELYHFDYNEEGRLIKETDFSGAITQYRYNTDGQITETHKPSGHINRYRYDSAGRISEILHDDGTIVSYEYDKRGLLTKADNQDCPVSFRYDALGRLIRETQGGHYIEHEYDTLSNRIRRTTDLSDLTEFAWDANGQISHITPQGFNTIQFEYDERGYESNRRFGFQMTFEQHVDQRGRLIEQTLNQHSGYKQNLLHRHYQYDAASNLLSKQDSLWGITQYTYDILERIESTLHPDQILERFTYDANSNISSYQQHQIKPNSKVTAQSISNTPNHWQYQQGNPLIKHDDTHYEYDADGQLIRKIDNKGTTYYHWNRQGQLKSIQKPDGNKWFYSYDALSRRIAKRSINTYIEYVWDGDVILYETQHNTKNEALSITHLWEYHPHDFSPLYKLENRQQQYFSINDQIGTPLELVDKKGQIAWSERLETFGNNKTKNKNNIECPIRFQGQWYDAESELHYNRFRYYDPNSITYINLDPIGLLGGINPKTYIENPNKLIDPFGLSKKCPKLSEHNPVPKAIQQAYEEIKLNIITKGGHTIDPNKARPRMSGGRQKVFEAREMKRQRRLSQARNWEGSKEWQVFDNGRPTDHRILQREDGRLGYAPNHDYLNVRFFPSPWYPDGK